MPLLMEDKIKDTSDRSKQQGARLSFLHFGQFFK